MPRTSRRTVERRTTTRWELGSATWPGVTAPRPLTFDLQQHEVLVGQQLRQLALHLPDVLDLLQLLQALGDVLFAGQPLAGGMVQPGLRGHWTRSAGDRLVKFTSSWRGHSHL